MKLGLVIVAGCIVAYESQRHHADIVSTESVQAPSEFSAAENSASGLSFVDDGQNRDVIN